MSKERILPYEVATKIDRDEASRISGAGTTYATVEATFTPEGGADVRGDAQYDM